MIYIIKKKACDYFLEKLINVKYLFLNKCTCRYNNTIKYKTYTCSTNRNFILYLIST